MKPVLLDDKLEKKLSGEGYIIVPFLSHDEVSSLKAAYYTQHPTVLDGMYATAHVPDITLRMSMNEAIRQTFARAIDNTFTHINALGGSFIAKGKGDKGTLKPHQDWNIVDEDLYRSFNVWVPLVDLNENNGTICIMPGSHLWSKTYRSANISSIYQDVEAALWEKMSKLYLKAGEALIYDHRLIHASGPNKTDEIRLATVFGIIPEEAEMKYYHQKNADTIEVYQSNPEFFLYGNIFEGPKGLKMSHELPYKNKNISSQEFKNRLNPRKGFLSSIKNMFWR